MKIYAKLLVVAFIALLFSIGSVAAIEDTNSSDITQVPHEQVVSVAEPTVPEVEATDLETSADNEEGLSASDNNPVSIKDSEVKEESDIEKESKNSVLGVSNEDEILGASNQEDIIEIQDNQDVLSETIYLDGYMFQDLRNAIARAKDGDVIDLQGRTLTGVNPGFLVENKKISIVNGVLDGSGITNPQVLDFHYCTIENITFTNYNYISQHDRMFKFDNVYLKNVRFENIVGDTIGNIIFKACVYTWQSIFDNVTFKNMASTYQQHNNEYGVNVVSYYSKFYNCTFQNTKTYQHSAAICVAGVSGNTVDIIDSKFINCTSGIGGAVYVHGTNTNENLHSNIINCDFINCTATEWGGAIGSSQDFLNVENCNFINNTAKQGAAIMIGGITHGLDGDNSQGHNDTIKNCYFYNNVGTEEGGSIHITGHNNTIAECMFDDNFAENGQGAAIYIEGHNSTVTGSNFTNHEAINGTIFIEGNNAKIANSHFDINEAISSGAAVYIHGQDAVIDDSLFTNHKSEMGTVYIKGEHASVINSQFINNEATIDGGGLYIEGDYSLVDNTIFENNTAHRQGGAIHTIGNHTKITNSKFYDNDAIPNSLDPEYGLGGAIYISGNNNEISKSKFEGNTARNGSAIYTKGRELHIEDDEFIENRAWSYLLITKATPPEDYWSEDLEFILNITLVGGDNIINAIYNDAHVGDIYFHNVTYELSDYSLFNASMRTTTETEIHPINGVENSNGGRILYQDSREDNQLITLNITYGGAEVYNNNNLITNLYGNVLVPIRKENLTEKEFHPGVYTANAAHPEDMLYTAIENSTTFRVLPHVDVSVTKTSNKDVYFVGENAIFTITVNSIGTNATNVTVKDILPGSLKYVSARATQGSYDSTTNEWYIGFMPHGDSQTLTLTVQTTELGTYDNVVNVTCTERDWNLSNNVDNKTIHVDLYYTKEANVTQASAGEYIEYYIRIYNTGDTDYTEVFRVHDMMPEGIRYAGEYLVEGADLVKQPVLYPDEQVWDLTNIAARTHAKITMKALAVVDGLWNNSARVNDYPPVNYTVNVSSSADLHIIKDVIPNIVNKGDIVNWTIIVINHGPSIAFNVYVDDILPEGLEIAGHATPSRNTRFDRSTGRWTIGTLGVEEYVTLIIPTKVTITAHNITNTAVVNSTTPDPDLTNNEDNATIYFNPDVSLNKTVSTQNTFHGDIISWTINVTNNGPNTANDVYVIDPLTTQGLRYINSTVTKGRNYNPVSGRWFIGTLEEGESAVLVINTLVTMYDGYIYNNATVYSSNDVDPNNNFDEDSTQVRTEADVGIVKLVSNQTSRYGDEIYWTIIVTNHGPNTAENVVVTDFLPISLSQTERIYISKGNPYHDGKWAIGNLANGESATLIVYTKVMVTDQLIINIANVTSSTHDPDLSNNEAENVTYVPPECDVQVVKTVSNFTPNKGDEIIWTISVINVGPDAAEHVVVHDLLPAGLEYVSHEIIPIVGSYSHTSGEWTIGTLEVNSRKILNILTRVVDTGNITNEVTVNTTTYDTDLNNNYDNETIHVPAVADLEIVKIVSNKNPKYGELINWTITVYNKGPNNARDVYVIDKLPAGLIYVTDSTKGVDYNPVSGKWTIGDLLHFHSATLTITTRVNITNATIVNVAVVNSSTPDENQTNNKANNTTYVDPVADLAIGKYVSNMHPGYNEEFSYYIMVTNLGPDTAVNAYVIDHLPKKLIYVSDDSNGNYNATTGVWKIGNLSAEAGLNSVILEIKVRVNVTQPDVITNEANVTSDTPDPDLTNNYDNVTIDVGHLADLKVVKIVSSNTSKYGDEITWTIRVYNFGPNDAIDVHVIDELPSELIYISHTVTKGTYYTDIGYWDIGDFEHIDNETYEELVILTRVNVTNMNITNVAVVNSTTPDNNESNNKANNTTVVDSFADLEIIKIVSNKTPRYGDIITWTITVINHGPNTAYNVNVTDKLPAGLIYKGDDSNGKYNSTTGLWNIGELASGKNASIIITTQVNITNATIVNVAVVNSTTPDNNESNNKANNTTYVAPEVDLEIIKLVSNKTSKYGQVITWTIIVTNRGPDTARRVFVKEDFPQEMIMTGYTKTKGLFDTDSMIWFIEEMAYNDTETLTITAIVNITNGNITNYVNVTNDVYDPNETNNEANNTTAVDPKANLVVVKLVSNKTSELGDVIIWTIIVTNNGPDEAINVNVTDKLPAGLIYQGDDSNGKYNSTTGLWNVGNLAVGANATLKITTLVNTTNATIINVANATSDTPGNNTPGNNTTDVKPMADLEIIKIVSNTTSKYGDVITWTIIVTNKGPDTAKDVVVKDKLPAGLTYTGHTVDTGLYDPSKGIWSIGDMAKDDSFKLVITTIVNITNGNITNVAVVNSTTPDKNESNNEANNTTHVDPKANLVVVKLVSNQTSQFGDVITWTIIVTNKGPDAAVNVTVTDKLPAGLVYQGDDSNGNYNKDTGIWKVGDLANGASATLKITTLVNTTNATILNVANATSDTPGNNTPGNNTTVVDPAADLVIVKIVSKTTSKYGDVITWTIIVTNKGPDTAKNVVVTDKLPAGLIYNGHTADEGLYDSSKGIWSIGDMAKDDSFKLVITTIVNMTNGNITNVAVVNSTTPDKNESNNEANNTTVVDPKANLVVVKVVSSQTSNFGDLIIWTIIVTNKGPDTAVNVTVTDKLPAGLVYQGDDSHGKYNNDTGIWKVGDLANGASATLRIATLVNTTNATILNVANATSDTPGNSTPGNNTTDVKPMADLEIVKIVSKTTSKYGDVITWTIIVTNNGPDTAKDVVVKDKLPAGLTYTGHTVDTGLYDPSKGIWSVGDMAKDDSFKLVITTIVNMTNGNITNVAVVNSTTPDKNESNNEANNTTHVDPKANLVVVKLVSNQTSQFGDVITWTIIVTNKGPDTAVNVTVTDKLPAGLVYQGDDSQGKYNKDTGIWKVGDLANGASATIKITTLVNTTNATILNVANATSDTPGNNTPGNNTTVVDPAADLVIVKIVSSTTSKYGDVITWTIIVTNKGPDTAKNVVVTDKLPAGLIYNGHTADEGLYDSSKGIWSIGDMAKDDSFKLVITTIVNITNANITNVAVVNSTTPDKNESNNEANNTTHVDPKANLVVIKLVSNQTSQFGDVITWTIIVTNKGPDTAVNVTVTDKLPAGLVYQGDDSQGKYNKDTGIWKVGDLANGASATIKITTLVNTTDATILNVANATSDTPGNNTPGNNTTVVNPGADLVIVKLVSKTTSQKGDTITWTIIVTNKGPGTAKNVIVTDKLPTGLTYTGHTADEGLYDSSKGIWSIGDMAKDDTFKLVITTIVNISNGTITNVAVVNSTTPDNNESNNEANNTTTVENGNATDLEIIKEVSNKNPHKGDTITWTITVTNKGSFVAKDVTVTDYLPEGLKFLYANGNYNRNTGVWTIGDMNPGDVKKLIITTVVTITNANITNVAVVNSTTPDNNTDNNEDNDTANVTPEADLKIIKTVSNPTPGKGEKITWTIVVTNLGPDTAYDVEVSEELPEGLKLLKAKGSKGSYSNGKWTIGTLKNGEMVTLTLTTEVLVENGTIENIVVVTSSTYDPDESNNVDKEITNPDGVYNDGSKDHPEGGDKGFKKYSEDEDDEDSEDGDDPTPTEKQVPPKYPKASTSRSKMHATGNPILMGLLALLSVCGVVLRRRN